MTSKLALEDCADLVAQGLQPTAKDIIRLNALALKIDEARGRGPISSLFFLPRVAQIADGIHFRQPSIGHEIWLAAASRWVSEDWQSLLALNAYALAEDDAEDLCDPNDIDAVKDAVEDACRRLARFTTDQLYAAINYVRHGVSETDGEMPPERKPDADDDEVIDWDLCVACGVLAQAQTVMWGMTAADLKRMTRRQVEEMTARALVLHHISTDNAEKRAIGDYYATLDEIKSRLVAEKDSQRAKPGEERLDAGRQTAHNNPADAERANNVN